MSGLLASSDSGAKAVVGVTKDFLRCYRNHALTKWSVDFPGPVYPSKSFSTSLDGKLRYTPPSSTKLEISTLACVIVEGKSRLISELLVNLKQYMTSTQFQDEIDSALFLADFFGQEEASDLLLKYKPNPGRKDSSNGLHGAAGQGLEEETLEYLYDGANSDVLDEFGATPIMYAMQSESHDWKTIELLIEEGADPRYRIYIDGVSWSYPDIATAMSKPDLAKLLEEAILEMPEDEETDVPSRS